MDANSSAGSVPDSMLFFRVSEFSVVTLPRLGEIVPDSEFPVKSSCLHIDQQLPGETSCFTRWKCKP